jgi:hypothetical protein
LQDLELVFKACIVNKARTSADCILAPKVCHRDDLFDAPSSSPSQSLMKATLPVWFLFVMNWCFDDSDIIHRVVATAMTACRLPPNHHPQGIWSSSSTTCAQCCQSQHN